jgi:hypothetical protein
MLTQNNPTKINRGERMAEKDTWARGGRNVAPLIGGNKPAKGKKPMSAAGRNAQTAQKEGGSSSPARPRMSAPA